MADRAGGRCGCWACWRERASKEGGAAAGQRLPAAGPPARRTSARACERRPRSSASTCFRRTSGAAVRPRFGSRSFNAGALAEVVATRGFAGKRRRSGRHGVGIQRPRAASRGLDKGRSAGGGVHGEAGLQSGAGAGEKRGGGERSRMDRAGNERRVEGERSEKRGGGPEAESSLVRGRQSKSKVDLRPRRIPRSAPHVLRVAKRAGSLEAWLVACGFKRAEGGDGRRDARQ